MARIKRVDITNGQWMTWVEITPTHSEVLWLNHEPTEAEAEAFVADWLTQHQYDETPHKVLSIYDEKEAIEAAVVFIKTTASLTLTKWNNYLATLSFANKYAVQWFIFSTVAVVGYPLILRKRAAEGAPPHASESPEG